MSGEGSEEGAPDSSHIQTFLSVCFYLQLKNTTTSIQEHPCDFKGTANSERMNLRPPSTSAPQHLSRGGLNGRLLCHSRRITPFTRKDEKPLISARSATSMAEKAQDVGCTSLKETIMLQGFGWDSCRAGGWWNVLKEKAPEIARAGFTHVWLPPPSQSVSEEGYLPSQLYNFDSKYGTEAEMRACVSALKQAGVKPVADLVLNHRCADKQDENGEWVIFSDACEPEGVATCAWKSWAITSDDPAFGGRGATDTGEDFHAAPDIDHTRPEVQAGYADWIRHLTQNVGFEGLRFDFSKGYAGKYAGLYSRDTVGSDYFAVGEYWKPLEYDAKGALVYDQEPSRLELMAWFEDAGEGVFAFDFATKGILQEAIRYKKYDWLVDGDNKPHGLIGSAPARSVTFVDNHDTGSTQAHWPFPKSKKLEGYAYIMTHPGMPTVFWEHLYMDSNRVKEGVLEMIEMRKRNGIQSDSSINILATKPDGYVAEIAGTRGAVRVKLGPSKELDTFEPSSDDGWAVASKGFNYCIWEQVR